MRRFLVIVGLLAFACPAHADGDNDDKKFGNPWQWGNDDKKKGGDKPIILLLGGADLGLALHPDQVGGLLGGEVSVAYFDVNRGFWGGLYLDTAYDTANSATRLSIGPEAGWAYFGVDGGFVHQFSGDGPEGGSRNGLAVRPCLTIAIATLYFRHVLFFDDQPGASINELGLLLKWGWSLNGDGPSLR